MARRQRIGIVGAGNEHGALFVAAIRKAGAEAVRIDGDDTATIAICDRFVLVDPVKPPVLAMLVPLGLPILAQPGQIAGEEYPLLTQVSAYRYAPFADAVRSAIMAGRLGGDIHISVRWGQLPRDWASDPAVWRCDAPGVLATAGADCIDILDWWLGPVDLAAVRYDGLGGPDAEAEFDFRAAGARGHVELSRLRQLENKMVIAGPRGHIEVDLVSFKAKSQSPDLLGRQQASKGASLVELQTRRIQAWLAAEQPPARVVASVTRERPEIGRLRHAWEVEDAAPFPRLRGRRILVVGATGFIGARLVERLAQQQAVVTAVARDMRRAARIARCGISVACMGTDDAALAALVAGNDVVINLAYDLSATATANAAAAERLARACLAAKVGRFVHASSIAVYDGWPDQDLNEASPSDGPGHEYKLGKRATERALANLAGDGAMGLTILQFTNVYGPFSRLWTDDFAERLQAGPVAVPGDSLCNGVFLEDAVDALLAASDVGAACGTFIITGPAPFRWCDLLQGYADALGGKVIVEPTLEAPSASPRKPGFLASLPDPLALARTPLLRPLVDRLRRRTGEERLGLLRRRIMQVLARGKPTIFRAASANPRLFAAHATVTAERAAAALIAPRIGLDRGLDICRRYFRWRYGERPSAKL